MYRLASILLFTSILVGNSHAQSAGPPKFDIAAACREAGAQHDPTTRAEVVKRCVASENAARKELEKQWPRMNPVTRADCVGTASVGSIKPTYSEVISCIEMKAR